MLVPLMPNIFHFELAGVKIISHSWVHFHIQPQSKPKLFIELLVVYLFKAGFNSMIEDRSINSLILIWVSWIEYFYTQQVLISSILFD